MTWSQAIKAALISIPKIIDAIQSIADLIAKLIDEQKANRLFLERVKEFELAKDKAYNENNTSEFNHLIRNPPRFK